MCDNWRCESPPPPPSLPSRKRQRKDEDYFHSGNERINRIDNHIYFYSDVSTKNNLQFIKILRDTDHEQQIKMLKEEITEPVIHIHINSSGGSLLDGFSMASSVLSCKSHTIGYCEGKVASAATLPFVVCNERKMQRFCYVLIHQLSSSFWGTYESFKDEKVNLDNFMKQLQNLYSKYTNMPAKKITDIMKHDLFFDAKACLKYKIVDELC